MMDTFEILKTQHTRDTILRTANRLHDHFKKFTRKKESLQNKPEEVDEAEWKFLVEYFSSEAFKNMSEKNKINTAKQEFNHIYGRKSFQAVSFEKRHQITRKEPNFQKLWEMTHSKSNGHWVNDASAELNVHKKLLSLLLNMTIETMRSLKFKACITYLWDKVKQYVAEHIQEMEEVTDEDPIMNNAFVKIIGERSGYCRGQGSGVKRASRRPMQGFQVQLQVQQKDVEAERNKREIVECKIVQVQNKLEEEQKNRQVMEARLGREQKKLKEGMLALVSHMLTSQAGLPTTILNLITDLKGSNEADPTSPMDDTMA